MHKFRSFCGFFGVATKYLFVGEQNDANTIELSEYFWATVITLCVSRRRRKMYCGHARLCVCPCVHSRPYAHTIARTRM